LVNIIINNLADIEKLINEKQTNKKIKTKQNKTQKKSVNRRRTDNTMAKRKRTKV